ncbi:MAG: hypothetical protein MMC33_005236 [Icmadophila ericetorum]|nr:hypothetical protein [Icmadophila ericetorum]
MLNGQSPWRYHFSQNAALICLSLFFLPLDTFLVCLSYVASIFFSSHHATRRRIRRSSSFHPKTILVTGMGMSKGLIIARLFYEAGHNVIGADFEPYGIPVCGRFSRALKKFYRLPKPDEAHGAALYIQQLLNAVRAEKVDLWISCSGVASAVEDGQAMEVLNRRSDCKSIQYDVKTTATLHEKHSFIQYTESLGLPAPETYDVTSRAAVHQVLHKRAKKQYIMKSVGVDDTVRGDMTLLPRRTVSETYNHLANLPVSPQKPWVLQQFIKGEEYCTHALVVKGEVKAFVACPSSELLMHYQALPPTSSLSQAMLKFTTKFAARSGKHMTGHLSFDFLVDEITTERGLEKKLYPVECNPRAHTAVVLFNGLGEPMAKAYLSALVSEMNGTASSHTSENVSPQKPDRYYWIGHDLVVLVLLPLLELLLRRRSQSAFLSSLVSFLDHLLLWKDGTFEIWDPLPAWVLYHIYWPGQFLACILHKKKWSRINVSTTKVFGC